jgi:hypothetical protein
MTGVVVVIASTSDRSGSSAGTGGIWFVVIAGSEAEIAALLD